jgi:CheY-like chemotaxis protein
LTTIISWSEGTIPSIPKMPRDLLFLIGIPYAHTRVVANRKKKILVVDDKDDCRALLSLCINLLGYEVFEAATAREAVDRVTTIHPDLIMMDLSLPGMSGEEATTCLKANPATREIPVLISIAVTAATQINRALETGAAEILHKPLDLLMLREVLSTYLPVEDATIKVLAR